MSLNCLYSIREGILGLKRARLATFLTVSTIAVSMTLFSALLLVTLNVADLVYRIKERMTFEVFLESGLSGADTKRLQSVIENLEGVAGAVYISREDALERYRRDLNMDPLEIVEENPLPASFQVSMMPEYRSARGTGRLKQEIEGYEGVNEVIYHGGLYELLDRTGRYVLVADAALLIFIIFAVVLLVSNTLRLTILSHRRSIQIMDLVGATRAFIRRPYIVQGVIQGALGGGAATILLYCAVLLFSSRFPNALRYSHIVILLPLAMGIILSFFGSRIGIKRFLKGL